MFADVTLIPRTQAEACRIQATAQLPGDSLSVFGVYYEHRQGVFGVCYEHRQGVLVFLRGGESEPSIVQSA